MIKCKFCGAEIPEDSLFCSECGGKDPIGSPVVETTPEPSEKPKKKKKGLVIGIVAGVVALILVAGAVLFFVFKDDIMALFDKESTSDEAGEEESTEDDSAEPEEDSTSIDNNDETDIPESVVLGDSIYDGTIEIEGAVYQLPCAADDFIDNGWVPDVDLDSEKIGGFASEDYYFEKDENKTIVVTFFNFDVNEKTASECSCVSIYVINENISVKLPGNIDETFTFEELKSAYGTPIYDDGSNIDFAKTDIDEENLLNCLPGQWYTDLSVYSDFDFTYTRIVIPADFNPVLSSTAPEYLSNYNAPVALGDDIDSGNIEIDGVVYNLPCPVSEFTDNGWTLDAADLYYIEGNLDWENYAVLKKGDYQIDVYIGNHSSSAVLPENGLITEIDVLKGYAPSVSLPKGIVLDGLFDNSDGTFGVLVEDITDTYVYAAGDTEIYIDIDENHAITGISFHRLNGLVY